VIVISDTSSLCYLLFLEEIELLPKLFGQIVIPPQVAAELANAHNHRLLQDWVASQPAWLKITAPAKLDESIQLDAGEVAAISLAMELRSDFVLLDDRLAREAATERGLIVMGTLGVLNRAAQEGLLELEPAVAKLKLTNFFATDAFLEQFLAAHRLWLQQHKDT